MMDSSVPPRNAVCRRPIGVTAVAVLGIIWSVLMLIAAAGMFVEAGMITYDGIPDAVADTVSPQLLDMIPVSLAAAGIMMLAFGIIGLAISWGLLKGRNWARVILIIILILSVISSAVSAVMSGILSADVLVSLGISILIPVIIIWYLSLRHVADWFRCRGGALR